MKKIKFKNLRIYKFYKLYQLIKMKISVVFYDKIHIVFCYKKYKNSRSIDEIKKTSVLYINSMRKLGNNFVGYKYSKNTTKPILYSTIANLLLKHLYKIKDEQNKIELDYLLSFQDEKDGLFKDPSIKCKKAEQLSWWGWKHLTLHVLNTLALYKEKPRFENLYIKKYNTPDKLTKYINSLDWGKQVPDTSNEIQNIGTMLQYERDFNSHTEYNQLLQIIYDKINKEQNKETGLFGVNFNSKKELSYGIQAGYHFWTLYFYDNQNIQNKEQIIDSLLLSQNKYGGYDYRMYSGACADIDSIDPLMRFLFITDYRKEDIINSLKKAKSNLLVNNNKDGGWVYRRNEAKKIFHKEMYSGKNISNVFYTWWRILGLAYCTKGINYIEKTESNFHFEKVPGVQFF